MPLTITRDADAFVVPDRLPVLPLRDVVLFPYVVMPLLVGRGASLAALERAAAADLFRVGVIARVHDVTTLQQGTVKVLVEGVARARITRYAAADRYLREV